MLLMPSLDQLVGRLSRVHATSSASLDTELKKHDDDYFVSSMLLWCFIHNLLCHLFGRSYWPALRLSVLICKTGMRIVFIFSHEKTSWDTTWKLSLHSAPKDVLQTFVVSKSRNREEWASNASGIVRQVWENINVRAPSSEDLEKCIQYPTSLG